MIEFGRGTVLSYHGLEPWGGHLYKVQEFGKSPVFRYCQEQLDIGTIVLTYLQNRLLCCKEQ